MAHYAFLDSNNIVTEVIVGKNEGENGIDWEQWYADFRGQPCKRTSYNTRGGQHPEGRPLRKNYASVGYTYSTNLDAFIPPQPFASWVLNEETCLWEAPIPHPNDSNQYFWDEPTISWVEAPLTQP